MTIEYCNYLANQLVGLKGRNGSVYEPPELVELPRKGPIQAVRDKDGIVRLVNWYEFRKPLYGVPKSKGGTYVTASDLNKLFSIGITYGIQKVYGWKGRYGYGLGFDSGYPAMYMAGCVLRHSSGKKMLCRRNHAGEMPEAYEDTKDWKTFRHTPTFTLISAVPPSDLSSVTSLPFEKTTKNIVLGPLKIYPKDVGGLVFLYKSYVKAMARDVRRIAREICSCGNFRMKLSVYNDIYTNKIHKDAYIEVLHQESYVGNFGYQGEFLIRNPHKVVPWSSRQPCFVYIEYENGSTEGSDYAWVHGHGFQKVDTSSFELSLIKTIRGLTPPFVD